MITDKQYEAIRHPANYGTKTESLLGKIAYKALEMAQDFGSKAPPGKDRALWLELQLTEKHKDIVLLIGSLRSVNAVLRDPLMVILKKIKAREFDLAIMA